MGLEDIRVRDGTLEDFPRAEALIAELFEIDRRTRPDLFGADEVPRPTYAELEELQRHNAGDWLLVEHDGDVVGFVLLLFHPRGRWRRREGWSVRVSVDVLGLLPEWQGMGLGKRLVDEAQRRTLRQGAGSVSANIWEFDEGVRGLEERMRQRERRQAEERERELAWEEGQRLRRERELAQERERSQKQGPAEGQDRALEERPVGAVQRRWDDDVGSTAWMMRRKRD